MGKKSRQRTRTAVAEQAVPEGAVGPRQPCPCGSGRRYKHCHGSGAPAAFVRRPFAGLPSEADIVALREFVPAATAPLRLIGSDRSVLLGSLLPGATPALVRSDGTIWLGLQVHHAYGDPSRDLAAVLERALEAEPDSMIGLPDDPGEGPRLQDLVVDEPLEISVHTGFDFWLSDVEVDEDDETAAAALQQANDAVNPTEKVEGVEAAYWTSVGDREYLRWVMSRDEDEVLDGLARLHAAGADHLVEGSRLIGTFRAHGLAVPVWDVPLGTGAAALADPAAQLVAAFEEGLASGAPLTAEERAARAGLASRQLTIR